MRSSDDLIPPYGHKMQQAHVSGYKGLDEPGAGGTLNPETQPKRSSFVENLGGNQDPVTVDKHNLRLIGMLSQDPRFLNTRTTADVNTQHWASKKAIRLIGAMRSLAGASRWRMRSNTRNVARRARPSTLRRPGGHAAEDRP